MTESQLWATIKSGLSHLDLTRVENLAAGGEPDVIVRRDGRIAKLELKVISGYKIDVEPTQIAYAVRALSNGETNSYLLGRKADTLLLWNITSVPKLLQHGIMVPRGRRRPNDYSTSSRARVFEQTLAFKTEKPWDWKGLEEAIFNA